MAENIDINDRKTSNKSFKKSCQYDKAIEGAIFHSDTSNNHEELLRTLNMKHSYSKKVTPSIMRLWKASVS